jgi:magnesium chelatase accessory protein
MQQRLDWARDGADWPHRGRSRFVDAGGLRWHVQHFESTRAGAPRALLIHGTGASTHSWRDFAPLLQSHFELLAMDLPGHAFTSLPAGGTFSSQLSLPGMARALAALLEAEDFAPDLVIGHSAGAAIGARLAIERAARAPAPSAAPGVPRLLVSLNGALLPLGGLAGRIFSPAARLMAVMPGVPRLFAWRAGDAQVLQRLLDSTGSTLDATGQALYQRLAGNAGHVEGALGMMAHWDLPAFAQDDLPRLATPLLLVVGDRDATVPPGDADRVVARLAGQVPVKRVSLEGLGHLAHEERPHAVLAPVLAAWRDLG